MPVIIDPATKASFQSTVNPSNTANLKWTDPSSNITYTISSGFNLNNNSNNEASDNVKYQVAPNGTVYVYTLHSSITSNLDDPDTLVNESTAHGGIVTYAINRDDAGKISVSIHQVQDMMQDTEGRQYGIQGGGLLSNIERFSTDQGEFLIAKYTSPAVTSGSDRDNISGTAIYSIDANGTTAPVDAKVWDAVSNASLADTVEASPKSVNTNIDSPYVGNTSSGTQNFTVIKAGDGTSVLMQMKDANNASMTRINADGTFGGVTTFNYSANNTTTQDDALKAIFSNNTVGGGASVTIDGKTFVYGAHLAENFGRAELTIDANGAPQLTNITYSSNNQSQGIFNQPDGSIDVVTGATTIKNAPDIGDGNQYLLIGNPANWQFVRVNTDGSLSAASELENTTATNVDSLNGSLGYSPMNDLPVVEYDVDGTTYKGWIMQTGAASDGRWWFYNPEVGFKAMTPQTQTGPTSEEPGRGDQNYYMINGRPTWISTQNTSIGQAGSPVAWVAEGGDIAPVVCFVAGTLILTDRGTVAIEELKIADMVNTVDHGLQPIRWIGSRRISFVEMLAKPKLCPIRISAGALGASVPHKDIMVSPQHRILLRSKLVERMFGTNEALTAAKNLLALPGVSTVKPTNDVVYYHIMLDEHELIVANGMIAETMLAGKMALEALSPGAREELLTIFPKLRDNLAERLTARQIVSGAKARKLVERSGKNTRELIS